jgi:hypothetical protein
MFPESSNSAQTVSGDQPFVIEKIENSSQNDGLIYIDPTTGQYIYSDGSPVYPTGNAPPPPPPAPVQYYYVYPTPVPTPYYASPTPPAQPYYPPPASQETVEDVIENSQPIEDLQNYQEYNEEDYQPIDENVEDYNIDDQQQYPQEDYNDYQEYDEGSYQEQTYEDLNY